MAAVKASANGVFINCPFDEDYAPTFQALVFGILACRFRPRSARELDDGGQTRIDKIYGLIGECRAVGRVARALIAAAGDHAEHLRLERGHAAVQPCAPRLAP